MTTLPPPGFSRVTLVPGAGLVPKEGKQSEEDKQSQPSIEDTEIKKSISNLEVSVTSETRKSIPKVEVPVISHSTQSIPKSEPEILEVRKNKPTPEVPTGPSVDLSSIISETIDIVKTYDNFLHDRKTKQAMAIYYLCKLYSSLGEYFNFLKRLDNFFCQYNVVTTNIYLEYCTTLPVYGDYKKIIKDTYDDTVMLPDISYPIPHSDIRTIVIDVSDNVFAGGNYTRTMNKIAMNINSTMVEHREVINGVRGNFPFWFDLLEKEAGNNEILSKYMFEIMSNILFLNSGINEESLILTIPTCGDVLSSE